MKAKTILRFPTGVNIASDVTVFVDREESSGTAPYKIVSVRKVLSNELEIEIDLEVELEAKFTTHTTKDTRTLSPGLVVRSKDQSDE